MGCEVPQETIDSLSQQALNFKLGQLKFVEEFDKLLPQEPELVLGKLSSEQVKALSALMAFCWLLKPLVWYLHIQKAAM